MPEIGKKAHNIRTHLKIVDQGSWPPQFAEFHILILKN
jgi:hypothetical protein